MSFSTAMRIASLTSRRRIRPCSTESKILTSPRRCFITIPLSDVLLRRCRQSARAHGDPAGTRLQLRNRESLEIDDRDRDAAEGAEPAQVHARAPYARPSTGKPRKWCIPAMQACYSRRYWSAWMPRLSNMDATCQKILLMFNALRYDRRMMYPVVSAPPDCESYRAEAIEPRLGAMRVMRPRARACTTCDIDAILSVRH